MSNLPYDGMWFGAQPPAPVEVSAAWGARAILTGDGANQWIDIVPDRRQLWQAEGADTAGFLTWLSGPFGAWLEAKCGTGAAIDPGSRETFALDARPYYATASARASYGYLYIGAWQATGFRAPTYRGTPGLDFTVVQIDRDGVTRPLSPRLDVANHSPTGFAWGYPGSGPSQLALAILCDAVGVERARPLYQLFKQERIATLDQDSGWEMNRINVIHWVARKEAAQK